MKTIKVQNLTSNQGNLVINQFLIDTKDAYYFQSYNTVICKVSKRNGKIYLDRDSWDYSRTTLKYLYNFLGQFYRYGLNKKEMTRLLNDKQSIFQLTNLN